MKGININCKYSPFVDMILAGQKTIETRATKSLHPYLGQRVGLIETGNGKAMLKGYAKISSYKEYTTSAEWAADIGAHRVDPGSAYDWTGYKVGYMLTDIEELQQPVPVSSRGIIAREV